MKKSRRNLFIAYILCIAICFLSCFIAFVNKGFYPFGNNTILSWDGYQMTGPFCYYVWDVMHGNASFFFNWDIAAGVNMLCVPDMISPLNLLYYFIPRDMVPAAQSWFFLIRIILAAISFQYFINTVVKNKLNLIFSSFCSCAYAMSIWAFSFANLPFLLDGFFYLPLICAFVVRLIEDNSHKKRYSIMLALSMLSGVQPAYICVLFVFIFTAIYIFSYIESPRRMTCILRLGIYTLLALGISLCLFGPIAIGALTSGRLSGGSFWNEFVTMLKSDTFQEDKRNFLSGMGEGVILVNSVLFCYRIWTKKDIKQKEANTAFVLMLCMLLPIFVEGIHLVWQGGNYVAFPLRGGYTIFFSIFYCLVQSVSAMNIEINIKCNKVSLGFVKFAVGVLMLILGIYMGYQNAFLYTPQQGLGASDGLYWQGTQLYQNLSKDTNPTKRYKVLDATLYHNYGFVADVPTIGNYIHLIPERALKVNQSLGYAQDYTRLSDVGGTAFSDALLGYGYTLSRTRNLSSILYQQLQNVDDVTIYENQYVFPFGFLIDKTYQDSQEIMEDMPFENHNRISEIVLGEKVLEIAEYPLCDGNISFNAEYDCAVYVYKKDMDFSGDINRLKFVVNDEPILCPTYLDLDNPYYATFFNDGILYLGAFSKGEQIDISYTVENDGKFQLAICNLEVLRENAPTEAVFDMSFALNGLSMSVSNPNEEAMLYLPISNIDGWKVEVNGKKIIPHTIFGNYMGIVVPTGKCDIKMTYYPAGFGGGVFVTILSGILLLIVDRIDIAEVIINRCCRFVKGIKIIYLGVIAGLVVLCIIFSLYTMNSMLQGILLRIHWFLYG